MLGRKAIERLSRARAVEERRRSNRTDDWLLRRGPSGGVADSLQCQSDGGSIPSNCSAVCSGVKSMCRCASLMPGITNRPIRSIRRASGAAFAIDVLGRTNFGDPGTADEQGVRELRGGSSEDLAVQQHGFRLPRRRRFAAARDNKHK